MRRGRLGVAALAVGAVLLVGAVLAYLGYAAWRSASIPPVGRDPWTHEITIHSDALGKDMRALAFMPPALASCTQKSVLVLFHGRGGDERQWMEGGAGDGVGIDGIAHRLIEAGTIPPIAIVSADIDDSYGVNSGPANDEYDHGAYFTYIADELMAAARDRASAFTSEPVDEFVAGLSMGGYAALNLALDSRSTIDGVGALSPAFFIDPPADRSWIYEGNGRQSLISLADGGAATNIRLFLGYGTADYDWIQSATDGLSEALGHRGTPHQPVVVPGAHDVGAWRQLAEPMLTALFPTSAC
jgi:enterochelin esterase-like enzyme